MELLVRNITDSIINFYLFIYFFLPKVSSKQTNQPTGILGSLRIFLDFKMFFFLNTLASVLPWGLTLHRWF